MRKRIFSAFLAVILIFGMMPVTAFAADSFEIRNGTPESAKETNHGYITIDKDNAAEGETVTITVNPAEEYQLESLTVVPTISTIADVLATVEGFPEGTGGMKEPPENAWVNNSDRYTFVVQSSSSQALSFYYSEYVNPNNGNKTGNSTYLLLNTPVTAGENGYTATNGTITLTFNMTNGVLTSIAVSSRNDNSQNSYGGTYTSSSITPAAPQTITPVKQTDVTYQFTMPANNVEVKAKFKSATPEPEPEPQGNYLDSLDDMFEAAIATGSNDTIYWDEGDALPNYIMKLLFENPNLSFDFKYTYEGVEHEIYIGPGQATNDDIEWYGPLWLLAKYGEKKDISAIPIHGVYVIQKGDTLNELAKKFNTTVDALLSLNPAIKNKNLIYPGTTLNY